MIQNRATLFLGIFIFLVPFLGLPSAWKTTLIVLSGLTLIALSVKIILPLPQAVAKKVVKKPRAKKVKTAEMVVETAIPEIQV